VKEKIARFSSGLPPASHQAVLRPQRLIERPIETLKHALTEEPSCHTGHHHFPVSFRSIFIVVLPLRSPS